MFGGGQVVGQGPPKTQSSLLLPLPPQTGYHLSMGKSMSFTANLCARVPVRSRLTPVLAALIMSISSAADANRIQSATGPDYLHGYAYLHELKYPPDFTHFDWANPEAPEGGEIRIPRFGTYDSFNTFVDIGRDVAGMGALDPENLYYDRLLEVADDEPLSQYGRLAEGVKVADDYSWFAFKLRDNAYWHDGVPITVDDVIFSINTFRTKGPAWMRSVLADISHVEKIGPREVRYVVKEGVQNVSFARSAAVLPIIPKHYWEQRDITQNMTEPPLGSGPYKITDYRLGRYVVYEKNEDYWGWDVPVNRGRFRFDRIKFDYFRDDKVQLEALRGYLVDIHEDPNPKNWHVEYNFPARRSGLFKTEVMEITHPVGLLRPLIWNLRRERFQDIRVREALWLLFDFEFINRVMNYNFFDRGRSMFQGAIEMEHQGPPDERELELLEPWRDRVPERVFGQAYQPSVNSGRRIQRDHIERAIELFAEAGWVQRNGQLVNEESGEVFKIEFLFAAHYIAREMMPYKQQLQAIGIDASIRVPELSNWSYRIQTRNFDATHKTEVPYRVIGQAIRNRYGSISAEMSYSTNWAYIKNPVIDELAEVVISATDKATYEAAVKAVDRVILWNFYYLPVAALPGLPLVYWDKFGRVETPPMERVPWLDAWWYDEQKANRIDGSIDVAVE